MYLSELLKYSPDKDVSAVLNEKEFDRFSRTTSESEGRLCIYVASLQYIKTIPDHTTMIITTEEIAKKINLFPQSKEAKVKRIQLSLVKTVVSAS